MQQLWRLTEPCILCHLHDWRLQVYSHVLDKYVHQDCLDQAISENRRTIETVTLTLEFDRKFADSKLDEEKRNEVCSSCNSRYDRC